MLSFQDVSKGDKIFHPSEPGRIAIVEEKSERAVIIRLEADNRRTASLYASEFDERAFERVPKR